VNTVAAASEELASSIQEIGRQVEQRRGRYEPRVRRRSARRRRSRDWPLRSAHVGRRSDPGSRRRPICWRSTPDRGGRAGEAGRGFAVSHPIKSLPPDAANAPASRGLQTTTRSAVAAVSDVATPSDRRSETRSQRRGPARRGNTRDFRNVQMAAQGRRRWPAIFQGDEHRRNHRSHAGPARS